MAVVGIIPAAGSGERLGASGPKAFAMCGGRSLLDWSLEVLLGLLLALVQRVHQLGGKDLLRPGEHLLLTRRKALVELADREVANHLGELVDVARLDLVAVVLEPAIPVLGHLRDVVLEHGQDLLDRDLVDHAA